MYILLKIQHIKYESNRIFLPRSCFRFFFGRCCLCTQQQCVVTGIWTDGNILLITLTENCFLKPSGRWFQALSDIPVAGLSGFYGRQPVESPSDVSRVGQFKSLTPTTKNIVNAWAVQAFNLSADGNYFLKTGTYSSKFDFRNCHVNEPAENMEIGEYLLYIHFDACQMASPFNTPCIYLSEHRKPHPTK